MMMKVEENRGGMTDFDVAIATPGYDGRVGTAFSGAVRPARLMPNPKAGTLSAARCGACHQGSQSRPRRIRLDKTANIPCG